MAEGFNWEKAHPHLFAAQPDAGAAVFFSRSTRDYYGQTHQDYTLDYHLACGALVEAAVDFEVVTSIPAAGRWPVLVLGCAVCLSAEEVAGLETYLRNGGTVVAFGPTGLRDPRAVPVQHPWLEQYGIRMQVEEPERVPSFPPYVQQPGLPARCAGFLHGVQIEPAGWVEVEAGAGRLHWSPGRLQTEAGALGLGVRVNSLLPEKNPRIVQSPPGWALRRFKDSRHTYLFGLPKTVVSVPHPTIMNAFTKEPIVERIETTRLGEESLVVAFDRLPASVRIFSPDLPASREMQWDETMTGKPGKIDLTGIRRFFIIQIPGR